MHFTLKNYQKLKLKNYFKNNSLFIFLNTSKLKTKEWVKVEQKFKKLGFKYYKLLNKITLKELENSIFVNHSSLINSSVLVINFENQSSEKLSANFKKFKHYFKNSFILISLKLNNKIYISKQVSNLQELSYKKNIFMLDRTLIRLIKSSYVLVN